MNKENGIKRLNRLSVKSKEYRDENTRVVKLSQAIEVIELIDQLDEPEKVVIPQFAGKRINYCPFCGERMISNGE
ncbi:hypothetical protein ACEN4K_03675 [Marinilactibacillus psychrotolerans]|uniref:hypothetical protein n=1 Tax=Marinilactibacillus psychrotolerans TaxID=191770 RepID=UPI00388936AB